ncbi:DNA topology modulation protein FlaR [Deinococcus sp.]|uniref:DNA topology modulation protein FlaR n=1 Tax=Deinococcus sp. TaxID=47478 RepID=UPI0025C0DB00|nr:DNA topology modulation protein FlaR [Deinococcus sp.]
MQRLLVIGSPGAGKSTLAQKLAAQTGLPLTHLDDLYWNPGWRKVERERWLSRLTDAPAGETWIIDGNFSSSLLRRAYAADTVIFLMPPRWLCLWRAFTREALGRHPHGGQQAGWPSQELLQDIWKFGPQAQWQLAQLKTVPGLRLVVLRSSAEIASYGIKMI